MQYERAYLELTYYKGRLLAAYLYLPRRKNDRSVRVDEFASGLVVDLADDGRAIGIEITAPRDVTLAQVNAALAQHGLQALPEEEWSPVQQAA